MYTTLTDMTEFILRSQLFLQLWCDVHERCGDLCLKVIHAYGKLIIQNTLHWPLTSSKRVTQNSANLKAK